LSSYPGYGGSEGAYRLRRIHGDALRWHDYMANEFKPSQIFVFGRSLGSGPAVQVAAARPVAGAVLVTPFDSLAAVAKRHYWYLPVDLLLRHRFDSDALAPKITARCFACAAERDTVIPSDHARKLYEVWAAPSLGFAAGRGSQQCRRVAGVLEKHRRLPAQSGHVRLAPWTLRPSSRH
jgi:dienelactone hydrolase